MSVSGRAVDVGYRVNSGRRWRMGNGSRGEFGRRTGKEEVIRREAEKFRDEGEMGLGCGINSAVDVCERDAFERVYRD